MTFYAEYGPIEEFLVGRCGKTEKEAMYVSFREFEMLSKGKEQEIRLAWEIARWEQFMQMGMSPYIKSIDKPRTPSGFFRLPWDAQEEKPKMQPLTKGQIDTLNDIREMFYKRKNS